MKPRLNLRQRLGLGLVGLTVAVTASFAVLLWAANGWLESYALDQILGHELDVYLQAHTAPQAVDEARTGLRYYHPEQFPQTPPPQNLAGLGAGSYRDFEIDAQRYHVLVRELAPGDRAWLLYDVRDFQRREQWTDRALVAGVLLCGLLAWLASGAVARRALQPLHALVRSIQQLPLDTAGARLQHHTDEGELGVIVDALNQRIAEIEALLVRERAFASASAHELRTPLTVIRNAAELAQAVPAQRAEAVARIERALRRASDTLDALLALSRAHEPPRAETLELSALLQQWAEPHLKDAQADGTQLVWSLAPLTRSVPASVLGIIFTNLLRNALRAARGREVRVSLSQGLLAVEDNGDGIPAEDLPQVFEPGTRGAHGGSGMGLYISKILADRQGWTLSLASAEGKGTRAELRF